MGPESVQRQRNVASDVFAMYFYFLTTSFTVIAHQLRSLVDRLTLSQAMFTISSAYADSTARPSLRYHP